MTMATIDEVDIETNKQEALSLFEDCSMAIGALCVVMDKKKQIERFVALLIAIRDKSAHGEWTPWVEQNFAGKLSLRQVQRMIAEYENPKLADERKLKDRQRSKATDLSLLETPREERVHGQVEVYQPYKQHQRDENAVPAEPKTNTLHKPATRKAKESDRPAPAVVTPEIVDEPVGFEVTLLSDFSIAEMLDYLKASADDPKKRAKELRKAADELDPPKKFTPPDLEDVRAYCLERRSKVDPEAFHAHYAANGWKQANGNKLADWKAAIITWEKRDDSNRGSSGSNRITTGRIKPAPVDESKIEYV